MDRTELLNRIQVRQAELDAVTVDLKQIFFGIDHQIDKIMEYIKAWYITPEIITRPLIIDLWGLTGVGKTSLIREIVNRLHFTNKFVEIQMGDDSSSSSYSSNTICSVLKQSAIGEKEAGIILLDEFQRFRTVDNHGNEVKSSRFQDIWMLLSDGKFAKDYSLFERIMDYTEYNLTEYDSEDAEQEEGSFAENLLGKDIVIDLDALGNLVVPETIKSKKKKPKKKVPYVEFKDKKLSRYQAKSLKDLLGNYCTLDFLKTRTIGEADELIKAYLQSEFNGTIDYSKCLIFISGNLDEAYSMSDDVEDCDTDADVFYQKTSLIAITDIKRALSTRFKPEQIARLGNNHIIYPSLNRDAYEKIIRSACKKYAIDAEQIAQIKFNVKESVTQEIYENSVYPAQGTRPVFSSIHKMFASPLTNGLFWGLVNDYNELDVEISAEKSAIIFANGDNSVDIPIDFDIRDKKEKYTLDFSSLLAVHESGHALMYALLFKSAPAQIKINLASFNGGFNQIGFKAPNKESLRNEICVMLGGGCAEETIFGPELLSAGYERDLYEATGLAAQCIRRLGMGEFSSYILKAEGNTHNEGVAASNGSIESFISKEKERTLTLLKEHKNILIRLSRTLIHKKELSGEEFIALFSDDLELNGTINQELYDTQGEYYKLLRDAK